MQVKSTLALFFIMLAIQFNRIMANREFMPDSAEADTKHDVKPSYNLIRLLSHLANAEHQKTLALNRGNNVESNDGEESIRPLSGSSARPLSYEDDHQDIYFCGWCFMHPSQETYEQCLHCYDKYFFNTNKRNKPPNSSKYWHSRAGRK